MSRPKIPKMTESLNFDFRFSQFRLAETLRPIANIVTHTPHIFLNPRFEDLKEISHPRLENAGIEL